MRLMSWLTGPRDDGPVLCGVLMVEGCDREGYDGIRGGMDGRLGLGPDRAGAPHMAAMPTCDGKSSITSVITTFGKSTYIASIEVAITVQSAMHHDMVKPSKRHLYLFLFEEGDPK